MKGRAEREGDKWCSVRKSEEVVSNNEYSFSILRHTLGPFLSPSFAFPLFFYKNRVTKQTPQHNTKEKKKKRKKEECAKR